MRGLEKHQGHSEIRGVSVFFEILLGGGKDGQFDRCMWTAGRREDGGR
jgi:hypothetical protein